LKPLLHLIFWTLPVKQQLQLFWILKLLLILPF
jgi:hypothetical protein